VADTFDPNAPMNPDDPSYDLGERYLPREGRKVFAIVGYYRKETPLGPGIVIGLVVIKDLDAPDENLTPPSDEGLMSKTELIHNAKGQVWEAAFARALRQPLKPGTPGKTGNIYWMRDNGDEKGAGFNDLIDLNFGCLIGTVEHRDYQRDGKDKKTSDVKRYEAAALAELGLTQDGDLTEAVKELIAKGEAAWDEAEVKRKERKARGPAGGNRSGGGGSGGSDG
jgi:hypothetical protein